MALSCRVLWWKPDFHPPLVTVIVGRRYGYIYGYFVYTWTATTS